LIRLLKDAREVADGLMIVQNEAESKRCHSFDVAAGNAVLEISTRWESVEH
jgi:hypothetical protein